MRSRKELCNILIKHLDYLKQFIDNIGMATVDPIGIAPITKTYGTTEWARNRDHCPQCDLILWEGDIDSAPDVELMPKYCSECGQRLNWEDK